MRLLLIVISIRSEGSMAQKALKFFATTTAQGGEKQK
jgi:hypothetical protein